MTTALARIARPPLTDYGARWLLIGVISLVSLIGLRAYGVSIAWEPLRRELTGAAFILILGMTYQWIGALTARRRTHDCSIRSVSLYRSALGGSYRPFPADVSGRGGGASLA
jgi:hypothetical protein